MSPDEARCELLPSLFVDRGEYAAQRLGRRHRSTSVRDIHVFGAHRRTATDVPRIGHRPRRGVPGIDGDSQEQSARHRAHAPAVHGESPRRRTMGVTSCSFSSVTERALGIQSG
jgi:hypothetical protein